MTCDNDVIFLQELSNHKCLAPEIKAKLRQLSMTVLRLKEAQSDAGWEADNLRSRERFDSYGQFDGYYA